MTPKTPNDIQPMNPTHPHCACCGPTEWDFSDDLLTPELLKKKKTLSKEAFEEMMKSML